MAKVTIPLILLICVVMGAKLYNQHVEQRERQYAVAEQTAETRRKIEEKRDDLLRQLTEAKAKPNPSEHDLWLIQHLEKMVKHIERVEKPTANSKQAWNLSVLENVSMVLIMLLGFLGMGLQQYRLKKGAPVKKGFHRPRYRQDFELDPVAQNTHWQPVRGGGTNIQTHRLISLNDGRLHLKSGGQLILFFGMFSAVGANAIIFGLIRFIEKQGVEFAVANPFDLLSALPTTGFIFLATGLLLTYFMGPVNSLFDKKNDLVKVGSKELPLRTIHALQIIKELAGGHNSGAFESYELNLVFKDGERINLMDHAHYSALNSDAERLAEYLDVPIWEVH